MVPSDERLGAVWLWHDFKRDQALRPDEQAETVADVVEWMESYVKGLYGDRPVPVIEDTCP